MAKKTKRKAPKKACPKCDKKVHARLKICSCGHKFRPKGRAASPKKAPSRVKAVRSAARNGSFTIAEILAGAVAIKQLGNAARAKRLLEVLA